jgi:hypothetical protein
MADYKHVGRIKGNNKKCGVVYRVVPGEPENCIIVLTESLDAAQHDSFMKTIESSMAQEAYELGEAMARSSLSDGRNMLAGFHTTGRMQKVATNMVQMTPNNVTSIDLNELNDVIAKQKGVTVADLALGGAVPAVDPVPNPAAAYAGDTPVAASVAADDGVITDESLAKKFRSDADRLSKEAADLRRQAEELVPTKRKTAKNKESA